MPRDKRLYMTFPNDIHRHPKVARLSIEARWAFIEMNGEARLADNDGLFSADDALYFWSPDLLAELCASHPTRPLVVFDADAATYLIRDYAEHQQTRAEREELSEKRANAGRLGGKRQASAKQVLSNPEQSQAEIEREKELEREKPKSSSAPTARGTRLTDSWQPSAELIAWARTERADIDPVKEFDGFRDYWISQPGQKGLKTDWDRTFKNWIRNSRGQTAKGSRWVTNTEQNLAYVASLRAQESLAHQFEIEGVA
jgi:hypothetical protein